MQGFILNVNKSHNEDLIVTILTRYKLKTLYRFYGVRHSNINLGYKIDFEAHSNKQKFMPNLRSVLHLSWSWLKDAKKLYIWQQYMKLLYNHLKDIQTLEEFYFTELSIASEKITKQNIKRVLLESYIKILHFEGRKDIHLNCFICNKEINKELALANSFLVSHLECVIAPKFNKVKMEYFFKEESSILFDDKEIDKLWEILLKGM